MRNGNGARPGTGSARVRALVSIHDVMPETLDRVAALLDLCTETAPGPVTLLVVPGRAWDAAGIARLAAWQAAGHWLAGHGWMHRAERFGGLYHRLHALAISRRVAEHLALAGPDIARLMTRCHAWFPAHGLAVPDLYVPPAWALGAIPRTTLAGQPFARIELLTGVLARDGHLQSVPMVGYEADTAARAPFVRLWNAYNRHRARRSGWLRIAVHPDDLKLRLARDLRRDLAVLTDRSGYNALPAAT